MPPVGNNDNKVTLELDLDLKDDAVRNAKRKLDDVAKKYEETFKQRRAALASGGRHSPGFMLADDDLKKVVKNVETAKASYLKAQTEFENRSRPVTKRVAGWFHKLLYGEKVQSSEDAEKEHRKLDHRMTTFQRKMHGTLALSSAVASTLAPIPGGGVLHAGIAGGAAGFAEGTVDPTTGERKKGVAGLAGGLAGGLKGAGMAAGLLLLAKGVAGFRTEENVPYQLGQAMGGDIYSREGRRRWQDVRRVAASQPGMTAEQAAPTVMGVLRAGGGAGAAQQALRVERTAGLGGAFTGLLGGLARTGAGQGQLDANAKKLWIEVLATGTAQGLSKGRIGELIVGAQQVASQRVMGTTMGDPTEILRLSRFLGKDAAFSGTRGFEMMGKVEGFVRGETSPLARAVSLMQSGLGRGTSMVEAMRRSEQGLFGGDAGGKSVERVQEFVGRFSKMAGGNRDLASLLMSQAGGMSVSASTKLFDLVKEGKFGKQDYERLKEEAQTDEQKSYKAIIASVDTWKHVDKLLDDIQKELGRIFKELGGTGAIVDMLRDVRDLLREIRDFATVAKREIADKGVIGGLASIVSGEGAAQQRRERQFADQMTKTFGEGWKNVTPERMTLTEEQQKQKESVYERLGMRGVTQNERFFEIEGKDKKKHFVIELRDPNGNLLALEELQDKEQTTSKPVQARTHK